MVFQCLMLFLEKTLAIELKNVLTSKTFSNSNESLHWERERERDAICCALPNGSTVKDTSQ